MSEFWFGNRNRMVAIPPFNAGASYGRQGHFASMDFSNGGAHRRRSLSGARTYGLEWAPKYTRDQLRPLTDFYEGVYGPGPYYWLDPYAADKNVLAQSWATPSLGGYDGVILSNRVRRPALVSTSANSLGYPAESAVYEMTTAEGLGASHWVPIPQGYTAWVGVHGSYSGVGVRVRPTTGPGTYGATVTPVALSVLTETRVNTSFSSASFTGIELTLSGNGSCVLSGIIVQVLPTGTTPATGGFISGQGHSGCEFDSYPAIEAYSAAMDKMGATADFTEVGQWL